MEAPLFGAGDGNRTHVISLEGWSSTIELHPHVPRRDFVIINTFFENVKKNFIKGLFEGEVILVCAVGAHFMPKGLLEIQKRKA